ncbi:MAG: hypothetical protein KDE53_37110 [Caldilineaceae bacterium]|nr:hypothetical protein [Caldilineaceae bacterium]
MPQSTELLQPTSAFSPPSISADMVLHVEQRALSSCEASRVSQQIATNHTATRIDPDGALGRLLAAAVINRNVCHLLLTNPSVAVARGYQGESFALSPSEWEVLLSVRATSLRDFAQRLLAMIAAHNAAHNVAHNAAHKE